ncbi:hypothetical protein BC834DRAFT_603131 [Gloeopeniophorella convolvens]|nr:hypothetical protein BC834DRAFT_603131 [Gloeopeniophorella convolvens]
MAIRNLLSQANCRDEAWSVIAAFAQASPKVQGHDSVYFKAIQGTRYIDHLLSTRAFPVLQMLRRINERELHEARDVLIDHKNKIEELRDLSDEADRLEGLDRSISTLIQRMADSTSGLTEFLPLYHRNDPSLPPPDYFLLPGVSRADQWQVLRTSFTLPGRLLKLLSNLAVEALRVLDNKGSGDAVSRMKRLTSLLHPLVVHHQLIYMQLMRAYDHSVGGGFGHNLELFFWQVKHFSRFRPQDTLHPDAELLKMYVTVFDTLTKSCDDRARYSVGTQQLLLNITCEVLHVRVGFLSSASLPPSLIDKFIDFIRVYFQDTEANDKWITDTRKELERCKDVELRNKALRALPQPSSPQRSS